MLGAGFPILPADRSQLDAAISMFEESRHIMHPETLGRRLYQLAFLEGDPEQPYGLHLQVQSQTFYRMMMGRYYDMKLNQILESMARGEASQGGPVAAYSVTVKVVPGKPVLQALDMRKAFQTYDRLTTDFWQNYAVSFEEAAAKRMRDGQEEPVGNRGEFDSSFSDLPYDKKQAFAYLDPDKADLRYQSHLKELFNTAFRPLTDGDLSKDAYKNFDRRLTSAGTSTSGRDALP